MPWGATQPTPVNLSAFTSELSSQLTVSDAQLAQLAERFRLAMVAGLAGQPSSLKMLPSFINRPTGKEKGSAIAVDFGGTNVRVLRAELDGQGSCTIQARNRFALKDAAAGYDYTAADVPAEKLFGYIAQQIGQIAQPGVVSPLGHTFSFPCQQFALNRAQLIHWTKEIKTSGVEGQDISALLEAALAKANVTNVRPQAVINDTVGTLLAAAYGQPDVDIASICGTGHNTCYLEPKHPLNGQPMIVNMESGNFDEVPQTKHDRTLDEASDRPGFQKLEKMVSGYYLAEVVRTILADLAKQGGYAWGVCLTQRQLIQGRDLDTILADKGDLPATKTFMAERLGATECTPELLAAVKTAVTLVATRSARLVAATFAGALLHIDPKLERRHVIAIDGSLYEKMPGYAAMISEGLRGALGVRAAQVSTILAKNGSGVGAAIAAAV